MLAGWSRLLRGELRNTERMTTGLRVVNAPFDSLSNGTQINGETSLISRGNTCQRRELSYHVLLVDYGDFPEVSSGIHFESLTVFFGLYQLHHTRVNRRSKGTFCETL